MIGGDKLSIAFCKLPQYLSLVVLADQDLEQDEGFSNSVQDHVDCV